MLNSSMRQSFEGCVNSQNPQLAKLEILWNVCFMHWTKETKCLYMPDGSESRLQQIGMYKSSNDLAILMQSSFQEIVSQDSSNQTASSVSHDVDQPICDTDVDGQDFNEQLESSQLEDLNLAAADDDTLIRKFLNQNGTISIDTIWKHALEAEHQKVDVDQFLPKDPEVAQWIDSLEIRHSKISCSLKSYLEKECGILHVESAKNKQGRQNLAMIQRFYTFCLKFAEYHPSPCSHLSKSLLMYINNENFVLAFFLLLLRNDRTQKTVQQYKIALTKTVDYLVERDVLANTKSFTAAMSTLEIMCSGRKVADKRNRLKKSIQQAERLENFDMSEINNLLDVQEMEAYLDVSQKSFNIKNKRDKNKFLKMQGLTLLLFRTFNAAHLIELTSATCQNLHDSLKKASGTSIILEASTKFKGSQHKTDTIYHLSVPIRYKKSLQLYLDARRKVSVKTKELFITSLGSSADVANISSFIALFCADKGVKDIGCNAYRQFIETTAESELQQARSNVIGLNEAEQNRGELSSALLHSAKVVKRHYVKKHRKTSAYRSTFIDTVVQRASTSTTTEKEYDDQSKDVQDVR